MTANGDDGFMSTGQLWIQIFLFSNPSRRRLSRPRNLVAPPLLVTRQVPSINFIIGLPLLAWRDVLLSSLRLPENLTRSKLFHKRSRTFFGSVANE
jgi:hypothetical protein